MPKPWKPGSPHAIAIVTAKIGFLTLIIMNEMNVIFMSPQTVPQGIMQANFAHVTVICIIHTHPDSTHKYVTNCHVLILLRAMGVGKRHIPP